MPPTVSEPIEAPPRRRTKVLLAAVLAGLVLLAGGIGIGYDLSRDGGTSVGGRSPITAVPGNGSNDQVTGSLNVQAIANKVEPGIVDINTIIGSASSGVAGRAAGTGMLLTPSGEVLTNNHVIANSTSIRVTIAGRSGSFPAKVVGADPTDDVALIQIEGVSGLPTVTFAESAGLKVGQGVVAIGNALGQGGSPTVSDGTISALDRTITAGDFGSNSERLTGLIQTDAPISPGDSGGPLVNSTGQVVGMITAAATADSSQQTSTIGYAITSDAALSVVNEIRAGHASSKIVIGERGLLGVEVRTLTAPVAKQLGLSVASGALVVGIVPGGPAERIGIAQNSVITSINGRTIASATELGPAIYGHHPGEAIRVTWVDRSGTHSASATLIAGPAV
jgi:S1-C subfamily serine protease